MIPGNVPPLLLLLLLPGALPQLGLGTATRERPALLCDALIDDARRCSFCASATAAHIDCIKHHATDMQLLDGGTRRENCRHGTFEYSVYDIFIGRSLGAYGEFSEEEWHDVIQPALLRRRRGGEDAGVDAGPVGFDVGANIGVFTVPMAHVARRYSGHVVAIEADMANYALLKTNVALNRPDGRIEDRTVRMFHAAAATKPRAAVRTKSAININATMLARQSLGNFGSPDLSTAVERVSIDQIMTKEGLTQCDVLKVDVEGHELDVLHGAIATIKQHNPILYVENDRYSSPVLQYLSVLGYRCVWHVPPLFSPSNWRNSTRVLFTEESANLLCHHLSTAMGIPSWALKAQPVTAENQLSTLATARLEQNLKHYDLLGERYGGRWWLHSAQLLHAVADEGWGDWQRAAVERIERFFQSKPVRTVASEDEEARDRLLYALNTKAVLLKQHATTIVNQSAAQMRHTEAVTALRTALKIAPAPQRSAILTNLGNALTASGNTASAVECFNELLSSLFGNGTTGTRTIGPDQQMALEGKGWALHQANRFAEAADAYGQALAVGNKQGLPARPKMMVSRGVCLVRLGRLDVRAATHHQSSGPNCAHSNSSCNK